MGAHGGDAGRKVVAGSADLGSGGLLPHENILNSKSDENDAKCHVYKLEIVEDKVGKVGVTCIVAPGDEGGSSGDEGDGSRKELEPDDKLVLLHPKLSCLEGVRVNELA